MKNPLTLAALISITAALFKDEKHKNENTAYATEDGQVFFDENRAKLHAKTFEKKMKVHTITRTEAEGKTAAQKGNEDAEQEAKRQELLKEYESVLGKKPNANTGIDKLQKAIDDKKAELADGANQGTGEGTENENK